MATYLTQLEMAGDDPFMLRSSSERQNTCFGGAVTPCFEVLGLDGLRLYFRRSLRYSRLVNVLTGQRVLCL